LYSLLPPIHKQVPTWNYVVAHAHGRITIHDDERYVRGVVARLTRSHEASMPVPWKMTESPAEFINTLLGAIVGIEIEITKLVGKAKLSQNKEVLDIRTAAEQLAERNEHAISAAMLQVAAEKERPE
jgi:transcriptional regulator